MTLFWGLWRCCCYEPQLYCMQLFNSDVVPNFVSDWDWQKVKFLGRNSLRIITKLSMQTAIRFSPFWSLVLLLGWLYLKLHNVFVVKLNQADKDLSVRWRVIKTDILATLMKAAHSLGSSSACFYLNLTNLVVFLNVKKGNFTLVLILPLLVTEGSLQFHRHIERSKETPA